MGDRTCSEPDCTRRHLARGMCSRHYKKWRENDLPSRPVVEPCEVPACERQRFARKMCKRHYNNWQRHGDPVRPRRPRKMTSRGDGETKTCTRCGERKPLNSFSSTGRKSQEGLPCLRSDCKACAAAGMNRRYKEDPDSYRARSRDWYRQNAHKMSERSRRYNLKAKYGMTVEEFHAKLAAQDGRCAACGTTDHRASNWAIDHCHATGAVRGILCNPCNVALGLLRDDADRAVKLAIYRRSFDDVLASLLTASQVRQAQADN